MTAISVETFAAARTATRSTSRVRPEAAFRRSDVNSSGRPADVPIVSATLPLMSADAHVALLCAVGLGLHDSNAITTLALGLEAYRNQLAGRVRYFGPATPLDLRV